MASLVRCTCMSLTGCGFSSFSTDEPVCMGGCEEGGRGEREGEREGREGREGRERGRGGREGGKGRRKGREGEGREGREGEGRGREGRDLKSAVHSIAEKMLYH